MIHGEHGREINYLARDRQFMRRLQSGIAQILGGQLCPSQFAAMHGSGVGIVVNIGVAQNFSGLRGLNTP